MPVGAPVETRAARPIDGAAGVSVRIGFDSSSPFLQCQAEHSAQPYNNHGWKLPRLYPAQKNCVLVELERLWPNS
jgi:hypothetical protein